MFINPRAKIIGVVVAVLAGLNVMPRPAASYPVDCAILLCLAGGWPASAECLHAKAVFIRRITPYPVEPPLQVWRCPMGASYLQDEAAPPARLYDVLEREAANPVAQMSSPPIRVGNSARLAVSDEERERAVAIRKTLTRITANIASSDFRASSIWDAADLSAPSGPADINISDPAFDFVRSIRVYQIDASRWIEPGDGGTCIVRDNTRVGTYGAQGSFDWRRSSMNAAPVKFERPRIGRDCSPYRVRAMFVDWRDYEGNYGFERVDY